MTDVANLALRTELEAVIARHNLRFPHERARVVEAACELIATVEDDKLRLGHVRFVSRMVGTDVFTVNKLTNEHRDRRGEASNAIK